MKNQTTVGNIRRSRRPRWTSRATWAIASPKEERKGGMDGWREGGRARARQIKTMRNCTVSEQFKQEQQICVAPTSTPSTRLDSTIHSDQLVGQVSALRRQCL